MHLPAAGATVGLLVRHLGLLPEGLRAYGIPHRIHRRGCGFVVLVAEEDRIPAEVILRRVSASGD